MNTTLLRLVQTPKKVANMTGSETFTTVFFSVIIMHCTLTYYKYIKYNTTIIDNPLSAIRLEMHHDQHSKYSTTDAR